MAIPKVPAAVERGRQRRVAAATERFVRFQWFINEVSDKLRLSMRERVRIATQLLLSKVVLNISQPVTKTKGPISGRMVVSDRSKSGEFPRADTTQLMKTIFMDVREDTPGTVDGFVGSPLEYSLFLELKMNRSFLVRSLRENEGNIQRILTGPIK